MPKQLKLVHLVTLLCLLVFAFSTYTTAQEKDGLLKIHFFDIGQGDSIFIEAPNGNQVLIDGGPDGTILQKLGEVMSFYDRDIDVVIATHPHADHIVGLINVLGRYNIGKVIEAKESYNSSEFRAWNKAVEEEGSDNIEAIAGQVIDLGSGVTLNILYPLSSVKGTQPKNPHDAVVVAMLKYNGLEVMLTGDMEAKTERQLIMAGVDLDSDVLKVGHHGSKTSSSEEFLTAVSPETAIIQVGAKNLYGHPTREILERLKNYGIKYYRNDLNGDIKLISDGTNYLISAEK